MESKEAASYPISDASPGSYVSPSSADDNELLLSKTIDLTENNDGSSRNDTKGSLSEDEGYVSGNEEFEADGNLDSTAKVESLPMEGVVVNNVDDVDKGNKGDENVVVGGVAADGSSGVESFDSKGEVIDAVGKSSETSDVEVVKSGGEIVGGEEGKIMVSEVDTKEENTAKEEDDGSLSVGDQVSDPLAVEVGQVSVAEPEVSKLNDSGDMKPMPEEDSVVEYVKVDVAGPGVVVGETEETVDKPEDEVADVAVAVAEVEKSDFSAGDVNLTPEGDSVVDAIQVDMVESGVAVVGGTEKNESDDAEPMEVPLESVGGSTESGDGVVEEVSTKEVVVNSSVDDSVDAVESKPLNSEEYVVDDEKNDAGAVVNLVNGVQTSTTSDDSIDSSGALENGVLDKTHADGEVRIVDGLVGVDKDENQLDVSHAGIHAQEAEHNPQEIREVDDEIDEEVHRDSYLFDADSDGMIFGSSEAAKKFIEELERESAEDSHAGVDISRDQSQEIDGQLASDSEEEGETDDEGDGKEMFDSAALAALLKAATGADSGSGNITITSQDGSRLFTVERPAGLGSSLQSLRPAPRSNRPSLFSSLIPTGGGETEENLSEEEKKKLEKLQQIRVKFLRLVHRLGLSPDENVAQQVLYRLALLGGKQGTQTFSLDAAKRTALELEAGEKDDLDFSMNILVLGKSGVGKSATINSLFGEEKAAIDAFETGTASVKEISGLLDGVKIRVIDTPGLKSSVMEQGFNRGILTSAKKFTKKSPPDVVLYVDRLDSQNRDLNDLPMLKTVTSALGSSIWRSAIVTLTHAMSAPPDGPSGAPLSYEVFISQRSHVVQLYIGQAVGDLRMMSPGLMNPVSLVENHPSCRKNREGQKILPNGQVWRPQLLLLCYSMKILSEASSISKPQDPFDHRKLFGYRARSPPLPYMLSSMLQSRPHPKLPSDQGGDNVDSDVDLDDFSDSDQEEDDEYDQLPPFKPLRKAQMAKLSKEQRKAYFEEYDYRVKLLQKKQWKEELRRMRAIKKQGKDGAPDYGLPEDDADSGAASRVAVPLPDMALPLSFDGDNPAYRYRFLEPTSQFLARPVLDTHGWDHDCGYDGVNLEHSLGIANRFPASYTVQITKDKKDFTISLDSSISLKQGENLSTMAGFDIQGIGKQLAYIVRGETKIKNLKRNKATGGISFTFLGENIILGVKVEDQISFGKQYALVGSAGTVQSEHDTAYGANFELQRRELDYPIGQVQSTFSMSIIKWRGDLALGFNSLAQFAIGRNSKVAIRAGINNKLSGQVTVRTSSSEHLSLALAAVVPVALSVYKKLYPGAEEKFSIY